jgi:glycosyltransferase involved in cell wall biosynthesis
MRNETLLIIIPVFNEAATLGSVVERALVHAPVLVVDDGSTDDSTSRAELAGAEVIRHPRRLGKGQAIRSGLAAAAIRGATAVVTLDGDGQHDPADIPRLRAAAAARPDALVIGGRLGQSGRLVRGRVNAVRVAGFFTNWATGLRVEDTQSGFRLYPLALVRGLPTRRGGFVFETEVLVAAARHGVTVREVAVSTFARTSQRSRFRPLVDGVLIGAYLAQMAMGRWLVELKDGLAVAVMPVRRRRRVVAAAGWWQHPRRRRAAAVAWGMTLSPLLLGLAVCQSLLGLVGGRLAARYLPDVVSPVVARWFSQARLSSLSPDDPSVSAVETGMRSHAPAPFTAPPALSS